MNKYLGGAVCGASVLVWLLTAGCSSDDDGNGGGDGNAGTAATAGALNNGGANGGGTGGTNNGGPLTDDEVKELEEAACAGWQAEPENQPVVLQLVVDNSGSMGRPAPGENQSKWVITRDALKDAIGSLPGSTSLGVLYYPNRGTSASDEPRDPSACVNEQGSVEIATLGADGSAHRAALTESLDDADPDPDGGTPTHDAYNLAYARLGESRAVGARYMLLITDGQPTFSENCVGSGLTREPVDEQPIVDAIAAARVNNVRTFVIGSPGSEQNVSTGADARPWLSAAARAGDTPLDGCSAAGPNYCHFDMSEEADFATGLRNALAKIAGSIVSCVYDMPEPPEGEELSGNVNVIHTSGTGERELIRFDSSGTCSDGWDYNPENKQQIVLCEPTCKRIQADPASRLQLLFGCATKPNDVE